MPRVLLKISGEALAGSQGRGYHPPEMARIAREVATAASAGTEVGVVVGGGNVLRGRELSEDLVAPDAADRMGMLATVMNGIALTGALRAAGSPAEVLSAFPVGSFVTPFRADSCEKLLASGSVVVLVGGTGHPFFTTDTCASLRAVELRADALLKGTRVEGVFSADPELDPGAELYRRLTFDDVLARGLRVMDLTAIAFCREHDMPIRVFDMCKPDNIAKALAGADLGTLVNRAG